MISLKSWSGLAVRLRSQTFSIRILSRARRSIVTTRVVCSHASVPSDPTSSSPERPTQPQEEEKRSHQQDAAWEQVRSFTAAASESKSTAFDLEASIMRALRFSERGYFRKVLLGVLGGCLTILIVLYVLRDHIVQQTSEMASDVASKSLETPQLQESSQEALRKLLADARLLSSANDFVQRLLSQPETHAALVGLLRGLLADPETLSAADGAVKTLTASLLNDANTQTLLVGLLQRSISQPENTQALLTLLDHLVNDPHTLQLVTRLGVSLVHQLLDDETIRQHALQFVQGLLADRALHERGGEAIWASLKTGLTPRLFGGGSGGKEKEKEKDGQREGQKEEELGEVKAVAEVTKPQQQQQQQQQQLHHHHPQASASTVSVTEGTKPESSSPPSIPLSASSSSSPPSSPAASFSSDASASAAASQALPLSPSPSSSSTAPSPAQQPPVPLLVLDSPLLVLPPADLPTSPFATSPFSLSSKSSLTDFSFDYAYEHQDTTSTSCAACQSAQRSFDPNCAHCQHHVLQRSRNQPASSASISTTSAFASAPTSSSPSIPTANGRIVPLLPIEGDSTDGAYATARTPASDQPEGIPTDGNTASTLRNGDIDAVVLDRLERALQRRDYLFRPVTIWDVV